MNVSRLDKETFFLLRLLRRDAEQVPGANTLNSQQDDMCTAPPLVYFEAIPAAAQHRDLVI